MTTGKFIIAANHIGNIQDIPSRTIEAITNSEHIFCDFYHHFYNDIIKPYQIDVSQKTITAIEGKAEFEDLAESILVSGKDIVFICDNGLPGFADNGLELVKSIYQKNLPVEIIPGPSILPAALAISGISENDSDLYFMQMFSCSTEQKIEKLQSLKGFNVTAVILDFQDYVEDIILWANNILDGSRMVAICINVGMDSQKIIRGTLADLNGVSLNLGKSLTKDHVHVTIVIETPPKTER